MPEVMPSPRLGQRQVAPPLKARRGTVGTLDDANLAAAKRSTATAEDTLARLAGRQASAGDEPLYQVLACHLLQLPPLITGPWSEDGPATIPLKADRAVHI